MVVENDGTHGTISAKGEMHLEWGSHKLELLYFKHLRGGPVLKLQWAGGPHKMKRQVFKLKPDWDAIRNSVVDATCKLHAPNMNEAHHSLRCSNNYMRYVGQAGMCLYMHTMCCCIMPMFL